MINRIFLVPSISVILFSCTPTVTYSPTNTPLSSKISSSSSNTIQTIEILTPTSTSTNGFEEPEAEAWVKLMPIIRKYLYYRKKAVIAGNVNVLWEQFPDLKEGVDIPNGINAEEFYINNMKALNPFDGNTFPEYYERIKVKIEGETTQVLVHGLELYLCILNGQFDDSGGEFKLILFLRHQENQWNLNMTQDIAGP